MSNRRTKSRGGGRRNAELSKWKGKLKDTRDQLAKTKKEVRDLRKAVDEKDALITSLERQLIMRKGRRGKKEVGNEQARYYQQQLKRFKQDQQKWINRQRDMYKKEGVVVKYCFIDDIRRIEVYKKGKNRIKIQTRDGGEVIVKDIQIVKVSEVESKKKKKKRKKGAGADEDDEDEEPETLEDVKDQDEWLEIMRNLQAANDELSNQLSDAKAEAQAARDAADAANDQQPKQDFGPQAKAQKMVIEALLSEMDNRRQDLNTLSNLNKEGKGDGNAVAAAEELREDAVKRHRAQNDKLAQKMRTMSAAAKASGGDDAEIQEVAKWIEEDNQKWQRQLDALVDDTKNVDDLKKRNRAAMDELDGRIADVLKMKGLYESANDKNDNNARQNAETQFSSLQQSIKDRHEGVEQNMAITVDKTNKEDANLLKEMEDNDNDWRDAVFNTASHVTGLDEPEPVEEVKEEPKRPKVAIYDDEQKERCLDKDAKRREHIDTIAVGDDQADDVIEIENYVDRVMYHPPVQPRQRMSTTTTTMNQPLPFYMRKSQ